MVAYAEGMGEQLTVLDRQIVSILDRLHRLETGVVDPCRWRYDGARDSYSCDHLVLEGGAVIGEYERRNYFPNRQDCAELARAVRNGIEEAMQMQRR